MRKGNTQKGSALIGVMIVICLIGFFVYYTRTDEGENTSHNDPIETIKTYNKANDDLDDIRARLDAQNVLIEQEVSTTSPKSEEESYLLKN